MARVQRIEVPGGERTWTVLDPSGAIVREAEQVLEFMRSVQRSPNTIKSYARGLSLWWTFLERGGRRWDEVGAQDFADYLTWLRTGLGPQVAALGSVESRFSEQTIAVRLQAVYSLYRYHHLNGVAAASRVYTRSMGAGGQYRPFLEHIACRRLSARRVVKVRQRRRQQPPILTPKQIHLIKDACCVFVDGEWRGSLRDRLLFALLEEAGLRLGEALALQHRDWHTGRGDTPFIEVVPRDDHPHGLRVKGGGYRKLYVSDELDRLYGEYLWQLCDAGIDLAVGDLDEHYVFVNVAREPLWRAMRPETVYKLTARLDRALEARVPPAWTPHWFRHTHATALLLAGVPAHQVSRRLGHADVQTTLDLYGWVTEDAEMRALANWRVLTDRWRLR
jgi:site-specific recombinase XerD